MEFVKKFMTEKAEKFNGKAAMLGMFAVSYTHLTLPTNREV